MKILLEFHSQGTIDVVNPSSSTFPFKNEVPTLEDYNSSSQNLC